MFYFLNFYLLLLNNIIAQLSQYSLRTIKKI